LFLEWDGAEKKIAKQLDDSCLAILFVVVPGGPIHIFLHLIAHNFEVLNIKLLKSSKKLNK
jgi:hypothetical protein